MLRRNVTARGPQVTRRNIHYSSPRPKGELDAACTATPPVLVSWIGTFESRRTRRFDAYMIYSDTRGRIVDYLGSHEHLAVDIHLSVDAEGGLRLRSGAQRFYEGMIGFRFPMLFSGVADVREWYDERAGCFRIVVDVRNRQWGRLFGYRGSFNVEWRTVRDIPGHILPRRQEPRE